MDPELLRQRAAFQKHASRTVSVQQRPQIQLPSTSVSHTTYNAEAAKKKKKVLVQPAPKPEFDYSAKSIVSHSNAANFGTMAKIVDYMKKRHLSQQQWPLSLQEILDELQVYDLSKRSEAWLKEALPKNPRLTCDEESKFSYKPPYKIKGKTSLVAVAKKHHEDVRGGILLSELNDCIPNGEKVLEALSDQIIVVPTQVNKRKDKVFFYNDHDLDIFIEEEFKQIYRKVSVDHLDEKKIEEYLQKHGIDTMKDLAPKKIGIGPLKRKTPKRRQNVKVQNQHLEGVLEDYEEN
ncbi:hypothetical protein KIN20_035603 [Parelaphostrongylus tenuis]|uniref:Transcription initiation factor IIE subunit beta n=1 Tax=Parelaphostrongylus tenuis TaxID=148309 RepID=A0AAD5RBE0_PARTN|nr:hypothetical protein KIN20_035603 [Parelaphostrongylus tenuis]